MRLCGEFSTRDSDVASLKFFAVRLVLEIDSEEEVDHASRVSRRREAEEGVLHGCVL
jgi:hypothetical protein